MHVCPQLATVCMCVCVSICECVWVCLCTCSCVCDCVEPKANRKMHDLGTNVNTKPGALTHTKPHTHTPWHATAWPNISASAARSIASYSCPSPHASSTRCYFTNSSRSGCCSTTVCGLVTYKSDLHNSNNAHFGANALQTICSHTQIQITYARTNTTNNTHTHTHTLS